MRTVFTLLLLTAFLLASCIQSHPEQLPVISTTPTSTTSLLTYTLTSPAPTQTATSEPVMPSYTLTPSTPTETPTANSGFTFQQGMSFPTDRPLIAYEAGSAQNKTLVLTDPADSSIYEFKFPATARFATPFLAGLSPNGRYFVYFEGGSIESPYGYEMLRANKPDLVLHVLDLTSGKVIFSTPLLSPSYPQDLTSIAEMIKDDWNFTHFNVPFEDVVTATQELLLEYIRGVAWSPDSSLLAFASQDPGPSSDLYFYSPESGTARRMVANPGHVVRTTWAPDSSVLETETSFFSPQAREDTTFLLSREGLVQGLFISQIWFFHNWIDSTYGFLYGGTDSGDYFEPELISAANGTISLFWNGSFADIAFTPDLSTFLVSSVMPSAPAPPNPGLYLGKREDGSLQILSEIKGWGVDYWGSERFEFAASSIEGGTIGITPDGEVVSIDDGYWNLAVSPDRRYLAGYYRRLPGYVEGILPGLRIFDGNGLLLESKDDIHVTCVSWNAASNALAYQVESRLYLWDAASGAPRLVSDRLNQEECAFNWVSDNP